MNYEKILMKVRQNIFDYSEEQQIKATRIILECKKRKSFNNQNYAIQQQRLLFRTA
jgi:hypothetical protein